MRAGLGPECAPCGDRFLMTLERRTRLAVDGTPSPGTRRSNSSDSECARSVPATQSVRLATVAKCASKLAFCTANRRVYLMGVAVVLGATCAARV